MNKEVKTISLEALLKGYYSKGEKQETEIFTKIMPKKGDLIKFDLGSELIDPKEEFANEYRVLKIEGDLAYVVSMYDLEEMPFGDSQIYFRSNIDKYLQIKFYNSINEEIKEAIKCQNINQCNFRYGMNYDENKYASRADKEPDSTVCGQRYIASLDYTDILEYFDNKFSTEDIYKLFFKDEEHASEKNFWLRSARASTSNYCWYVNGYFGYVYYNCCNYSYAARPAFKIDLSKIPFEIIDEK